MRRKEREVTAFSEKLDIMRRCEVCRVAFQDGEYPYILPLNFGIGCEGEQVTLYFHSALQGKKMELIRKNPKAAFEMETSCQLVKTEDSHECTMLYESVMGTGTAELVEGAEKEQGIALLLRQYYGGQAFEVNPKVLAHTAVWKLTVREFTGKRNRR